MDGEKETHSTKLPVKSIFNNADLQKFIQSKTYEKILLFVQHLNESVKGQEISETVHPSANVQAILDVLATVETWLEEIPPIKQPMRFGNKAFRSWYDKLVEEAVPFHNSFLPGKVQSFSAELAFYFHESFGNRVRIDYGTGHETNFIAWLLCLHEIGFIQQSDFPAVVLCIFNKYLKLMRRIQLLYMLEPAGSHGVWGLDDYQCLSFYFGSAQLIGQACISPQSITNKDTVLLNSEKYMYMACIKFILEVKTGSPFAETSPMLYDISGLPTWEKTNSGLLKLYKGEVLNKLPVIQHLYFGSLLRCTWDPSSTIAPNRSQSDSFKPISAPVNDAGAVPGGMDAKAPWAT